MATKRAESRQVPFVKMHGAGNDFLVIDARELADGFVLSREIIAHLCHRRFGVGADGLLLIGPGLSAATDFRMTYYNSDGGEAQMCGNGARCSVAFAHDRGLCGDQCVFDTGAGIISGTVHGAGDVTVGLGGWTDFSLSSSLAENPWPVHGFCNTGVPHLVLVLAAGQSIDDVDLAVWGPRLRSDAGLGSQGANVNWVAFDEQAGEYLLRTFERGVEAETLACGTGAAAAAVVLSGLGRTPAAVRVRTRGGDLLEVTLDEKTQGISLRGPAVASFTGTVEIES